VCPLKKESGFTLIELLIVVSIVMILAVLASAFIRGDKGFPGTATHQPYHDSYYHN
jgi:prepilin-type N-terminal cleavage/methylation domain-containing protein